MNSGWGQPMPTLRRDAEEGLLEPMHTRCGERARANMNMTAHSPLAPS